MKITQLKQQVKDTERVSVFVDGKYSFSLTLDQLLKVKLKKDLVLDDAQIKNLKKLSDEGKLRTRALEWLMGRPHSTREFRDYLFRKKASKELSEALVEEFTAKNYLNDENFARWFSEGRARKNKSRRAIEAELRAKGIPLETIQNIVTESNLRDGEQQSLAELVNKLRKRSRYQDPQKLIAYLISKGFSYADVKEVLKNREDNQY